MQVGVFQALGTTDIYLVQYSDINIGFKVTNRDGEDYNLAGKTVRFRAALLDYSSSTAKIIIQDEALGLGYLDLTNADTGSLYNETNYRFDVVDGERVYPFSFGRIILIPYY